MARKEIQDAEVKRLLEQPILNPPN
jgi:hypothetical protein